MGGLVQILLISQDRDLREDVRAVVTGDGAPFVRRARQEFVERLQLVGGRDPRHATNAWRMEAVRSIDSATDVLDSMGAVDAPAFIAVIDTDWEEQESALLFILTIQALSDQTHVVVLSSRPNAGLRSLVEELGDLERCSILRKPVGQEEMCRVLTAIAWRCIVGHNLRASGEKGFSGVGAADLAGALLLESQAEQRRMAVQDTLTRLGNRRLFDAAVEDVFRLDPSRRSHALLLIDLDRFKAVNDTLGHAAGDELLKQVADRLRDAAGADDVVFRLGGDEFALLRPVHDSAQDVADAIVTAVGTPFEVHGNVVNIGASVGWATPVDGATDAADLVARADTALYAVKAGGRGAARKYTKEQDRQRQVRAALEDELRQRIADGPAPLMFAPIVCTASGVLLGAEAILDLTGDGEADLTEARLEKLLVDSTLALEVALWTAASAISIQKSMHGLRISANLTPRLFRSEQGAKRLGDAILAHRADPSLLTLEAPSVAVFQDVDIAITRIKALRDLGVGVELDDFGDCSFSIDALMRIPAIGAKIAPLFAHKAVASAQAAQTMRGLTLVASGAGLSVTATGVDTGALWLAMNAFKCASVQGRAVSSPLTRDQILARVERDAGRLGDHPGPATIPLR
ncbi:MAG: diguanylate cyclase domain-containing protein [Caulobacterales bacterium]